MPALPLPRAPRAWNGQSMRALVGETQPGRRRSCPSTSTGKGPQYGAGGAPEGTAHTGSGPCSETRLLEVLEGVCAPSDFACHQLLERSEEHVEQWWFHE